MSERLDVRRMLLKRGWEEHGRIGGPLSKGRASWGTVNQSGDSSLSLYDGKYAEFTIEFPRPVPARLIVAACETVGVPNTEVS